MTKVLILGGLAGQVDALESLRRRGVETHMCGHEKRTGRGRGGPFPHRGYHVC